MIFATTMIIMIMIIKNVMIKIIIILTIIMIIMIVIMIIFIIMIILIILSVFVAYNLQSNHHFEIVSINCFLQKLFFNFFFVFLMTNLYIWIPCQNLCLPRRLNSDIFSVFLSEQSMKVL